MPRVRINAWQSDPLTGPVIGENLTRLYIRRLEGCPEIQRMNEQKEDGNSSISGFVIWFVNTLLVITPAVAAPAPVRPAATVIATAAATAFVTSATVIATAAV